MQFVACGIKYAPFTLEIKEIIRKAARESQKSWSAAAWSVGSTLPPDPIDLFPTIASAKRLNLALQTLHLVTPCRFRGTETEFELLHMSYCLVLVLSGAFWVNQVALSGIYSLDVFGWFTDFVQ